MTDTINTRELIMNILLEMDREKTPCHLAVRDALDKYQFLPRQDRAFIKRVCEGTVEYGIQNDYIINQYSKIKINKCKPVIRAILRMSVYQIRFLDAVPDSAVVNEAVKLAEKKHFYNLKGFVNGVLRTIVREKDHLPMPKENNTTQYLSVKYSMPEFLVEEFVSQYGKETAETMMTDFLKENQVTIRINDRGDEEKPGKPGGRAGKSAVSWRGILSEKLRDDRITQCLPGGPVPDSGCELHDGGASGGSRAG
mgnify:CR=1 FL=1